MQLYVDSANVLYALGTKDEIDGDYLTDTVWTATVFDARGNAVSGATNINLPNVAGSLTINGNTYPDGNYRAQLPASVMFNRGARYQVLMVGVPVSGADDKTTKLIPLLADYDGAL